MEKAGIELHFAVLFAVLNDSVVKAVTQTLVGGPNGTDRSIVKKIHNL